MIREMLFVGGDRDGEWISVEIDSGHVRLLKKRQPIFYTSDPYPIETSIETVDYRIARLRDERGSDFSVFLAEGEDSLIGCLIDGYRKPI